MLLDDEVRQFLRARFLKDDLPEPLAEAFMDIFAESELMWHPLPEPIHRELEEEGLVCPECEGYHRHEGSECERLRLARQQAEALGHNIEDFKGLQEIWPQRIMRAKCRRCWRRVSVTETGSFGAALVQRCYGAVPWAVIKDTAEWATVVSGRLGHLIGPFAWESDLGPGPYRSSCLRCGRMVRIDEKDGKAWGAALVRPCLPEEPVASEAEDEADEAKVKGQTDD